MTGKPFEQNAMTQSLWSICRMQMRMDMAGGGRRGGGGGMPFGPFGAGGGSTGGFEFAFVGGGNPFAHSGSRGPSVYGSSRYSLSNLKFHG